MGREDHKDGGVGGEQELERLQEKWDAFWGCLGMSQESWSSQKRMASIGYNWKVFQGSPGELDGCSWRKGN